MLAVLMALGLVAAACGGADRSDDASNGDDSPTTSADAGEGGPADGFGDLASPCGPAEDGVELTDQGEFVTADSITIGYGDDAGYQAAPGLNSQMSDAVVAMIDWCNEQGGINGRTVVGNYYDAKILDSTNVMLEACDQVFMLVGQGWSLDGAAEQTRVGCELPQVPGYTVSSTVAHGPWTFNAVPNPVDLTPVGQAYLLAEEYPEEVTSAAAVFGDYAATRESTEKVLDTYPEAGWEFLADCQQTYPIAGNVQWQPIVQSLKDCGAQFVYFAGSPLPNFQNFLQAGDQQDYNPLWITDANFYDDSFVAANANGYADNVFVRLAFVPFEAADQNAATQQYLDVVEESGGEPALLGAQSTSAFLLWATAADACGAELTRDCMIDQLGQITSWTGGGLHAETNPAGNQPPECVIVMRMQGTEYVQAMPEELGEFACDESYVAAVSPDVPTVVEAQLGEDRISTAYTQ
ncbi:ABC transporter substrate-binding protein [Rhabdothermincola salaria]|uniref:ABC transporter substrate-binding protein n=1 Tax=Rhabdothermincola salaria TaxID=2903142 RepID=UPI001E5177DD|nr:ABC transporter substrate-binding protein [Rhabdothermincola salaria]MCD9625153.1 ABC transporter substrate-binding protein [Rhabdothermincola salaria]